MGKSLHKLIKFLLKNHRMIATAESITGGLIAKTFTDEPGSSYWFSSGVVSYSNDAKKRVLNVNDKTIEKYTEVSEECAKEMAEGVMKLFLADIGISTTGYAGPTGNDIGKVCFGVAIKDKNTITKTVQFDPVLSRKEIRNMAVDYAIELVYSTINPMSLEQENSNNKGHFCTCSKD